MHFEDEFQPQERDELFEKMRELIDAEVKKEMGNRNESLEWFQKERLIINGELSAARLKVRQLENERSKFLKEHTKTVQRELFGEYTLGDIVYHAESHKVGEVHCGTCNNTQKVEMAFGKRTFVVKCPDCPENYYARIIREYKPQRDEVSQINCKLWAGGSGKELEVYLKKRDGSLNGVKVFRTIEECQAYCDELNEKEQEKRRNDR